MIKVPPNELNATSLPWLFAAWGMDVIGPIKPAPSNGHRFILVAIDYFTKWANQKVAVYLRDAADAQAKLRKVLDRNDRSKKYARCKSRQKTLEGIRARGFDLSEELSQERADEHGARLLLSDAEDNEDEADEP
uniref:Uncharacterized protein LOC104240685 n=1 Tax=Nicotiana sylvestris TaxID=4096 RepID=A0A1U7Y3N4_NICSY|nr:PREDICTED: uncharacterized protein LOC104240685 [Nicotiana sylvestris]